jgi:glutamate-5-semialdehyde dehydrogenase
MNKISIKDKSKMASQAAFKLSAVDIDTRNRALQNIIDYLKNNTEQLQKINQQDLDYAEKNHLATPLFKRLKLDDSKLNDAVDGIKQLIQLPDPVGVTQMATTLDKGLELFRVTCPIGVIGVIFESRPDAFIQIASLCLKSGNAVLLKGGHEAQNTNQFLFQIFKKASEESGIPAGWIQILETRDDVNEMLKQRDDIDLIIPRGSNQFVQYIMDHTTIPVMGHSEGICHVYIDKDADLEKALRIAVDSKAQSVSVCNAAETFLLHQDLPVSFIKTLKKALDEVNVTIRGDEEISKIIPCDPATEKDWRTEYLDRIVSIKMVKNVDEAIWHINHYGSKHTDTIVTENNETAHKFLLEVDSAGVYQNASTRFADGYRYGFGAEVGISTGKLHARGPVGLEGLVTYKYKLIGHGQIVADYVNGKAHFMHQPLKKNCPL